MESITTAAIASTLIFKLLEKSGEKLGDAMSKKVGQLINAVRKKFRDKGVEGVLTQAEESPTEANKKMLQTILEMYLSQDKAFENLLKSLIDELKSDSQGNQVLLKDIDVDGNAEIGDIIQSAEFNDEIDQEAATNLKIRGDLKIGNIQQKRLFCWIF
ncbi:MAG: hypothetical protein AAFN93_26075, partial [Bacteroidota bacterium]